MAVPPTSRPAVVCGPSTLAPGKVVSREAGGRPYLAYVPGGLDGRAAPLLIAVHGNNGSAHDFVEATKLAEGAEAAGFVLALPQSKGPMWKRRGGATEEVAYLDAVLEDLRTATCVDPQRTYVAGLSAGGDVAQHFACARGDRIAALAIVASSLTVGGLTGSYCQARRPIPVLGIFGLRDRCQPFVASRLNPDSLDGRMAMDYWRAFNGCDAAEHETYHVGAARCRSAIHCAPGGAVEVCTIADGGHAWPGPPREEEGFCGGVASDELTANDALWKFFRAHPLPSTLPP